MMRTLDAHSVDSGFSNDRFIDDRKGSKHRCLRRLRFAYGDVTFTTIAAYAPMTCMPALVQSDLESIARAIRENIEGQIQHWLLQYIDRPNDVNLKVSAFALASQITRQAPLDADGIYGLLMLRRFNTSWASLSEDEIEDLDYKSTQEVDIVKVHDR